MDKKAVLELQSMPIASPSFGKGPWHFGRRQYYIVIFESEPDAIAAQVPWPLKPDGSNKVLFEVIAMPDSQMLGGYTESGIVIPCLLGDKPVNFVHQMYLDDVPAIILGRELWGFPKKFGNPYLEIAKETLRGGLVYNGDTVATATMEYKREDLLGEDHHRQHALEVARKMSKTQICLKNITGPDGSPQVKQLVGFELEKVQIDWAYQGEATLDLRGHVHAPMAKFPVKKVLMGNHFMTNLILPYGREEYNYLGEETWPVAK